MSRTDRPGPQTDRTQQTRDADNRHSDIYRPVTFRRYQTCDIQTLSDL